jgi:hypothetical protein
MKIRNRPLISAVLLAGTTLSHATLLTWQNAVSGAGTTPASTLFSTTTGAAPVVFNVGTLSGDRSFEFIVNSGPGGDSQALMGTQIAANGAQGLKFEQWQNTGMYGVTDFGVTDFVSTIPYDLNRDVHMVFTSDGTTTNMYVDGALRDNFLTPLRMTGNQGIAAARNTLDTAFFDNMAGSITGFASYDSALSQAEITTHFNAFTFIPEPGSLALLALGGFVVVRRRRSRR